MTEVDAKQPGKQMATEVRYAEATAVVGSTCGCADPHCREKDGTVELRLVGEDDLVFAIASYSPDEALAVCSSIVSAVEAVKGRSVRN